MIPDYRFDPNVLAEIAKKGIGLPPERGLDAVTAALDARYPGLLKTRRDWIFNNAGGAMGMLTLMYASPWEYLIFFGTPIGTEGHSGRYAAEVWDFMLDGEMWCYLEGETGRTVYGPGDTAHLGSGRVKGYRVPDHAWMLEYARGPIPLMMPFGLADSVFSTLDWKAVTRVVAGYATLTIRSLARDYLSL